MTVGPLNRRPDPAHLVPSTFGSPGVPAAFGLPPSGPPSPRPPTPGKFLVVLLVLLGLVAAALQTLPVFNPALPDPVPAESARPSSGPPSTSATARPGDTPNLLTKSRIYPLRVSGSCPRIDAPSGREAYEKQVSTMLGCLAGIFRPLVEQAGGDFEPVRHQFYGTRTESPCGTTRDAYAFYCETNATIYFSERVFKDSGYARLVVADVVIHEYGHHVQAMMGILRAADDLDEDQATITRRQELQVFCWTYYVFAALPSFALTVDDHSGFRQVWGSTDDPVGHGTVKAQEYWGPRGLAGAELGACNTWTVPASRVR